jgi:Uma2 family endonuclease
MLAISQQPRVSIKEYLEWEPQQDLRHEYINGEVFAMTGGTLAHNDITLNLYRTLYPHVQAYVLNHEMTRRSPYCKADYR